MRRSGSPKLKSVASRPRMRPPRGIKYEAFSPNVPNAEFFQHAHLILTLIAINLIGTFNALRLASAALLLCALLKPALQRMERRFQRPRGTLWTRHASGSSWAAAPIGRRCSMPPKS